MQTLQINKQTYPIISAMVISEMSAVGRAIFSIHSDTTPMGLITYEIDGFIVFLGFIERAQKTSPNAYRIVARELTAVFENLTPIAMRNKPILEVFKELEKLTSLKIVTQDKVWTNIKLPHFFCPGTGFLALDQLLLEGKCASPIYNLLPSGQLYVGNYLNSPFDQALELPEKIFSDLSAVSASLPIIPTLRPGTRLTIPGADTLFVEKIEFMQTQMRLHFTPNPWIKL